MRVYYHAEAEKNFASAFELELYQITYSYTMF